MTDTTRDAFEAWATSMGYGITRDADVYSGNLTEFSWEAWQAATEQGKRQPLTDNKIMQILDDVVFDTDDESYLKFAYAIEAAHDITATPKGKPSC